MPPAGPSPNFFIVGAPKCGTTALTRFLGQHPEVFLPTRKELHYFGSDLQKKKLYPVTRDEYLRFYASAGERQRAIGDASVMYLYSRRAASEIHAFNPRAKVLIMLRHPVDVMHAHHSQLLFGGFETVRDFTRALALEPQRRSGARVPRGAHLRDALFYRASVQFPEQVRRYLDVFGSAQTKIILYDDFRADNLGVFREVCGFLEIAGDFEPVLKSINANKQARSRFLQSVLDRRGPGRTVGKLVPDAVHWRLERANTKVMPRRPMAPELYEALSREFEHSIAELEALIGRDLSAWRARAEGGHGA